MSRFLSTTTLEVTQAAVPLVTRRFIQAAQPEVLQQRLLELQAALGNLSYVCTHLDLAGGGDGHSFVLATTWVPVAGAGVTVTNYGDPDLFRMFFALASESGALAVARQRVQASVAARFDETPTPASVTETDTFLAGAQMGTRFMMGVMTVVPAPD